MVLLSADSATSLLCAAPVHALILPLGALGWWSAGHLHQLHRRSYIRFDAAAVAANWVTQLSAKHE